MRRVRKLRAKLAGMVQQSRGSGAWLSPCMTYRYALWRTWSTFGRRYLLIVMLNPSTANAVDDDPTINKCIKIAKNHGYDGIIVVNCYALRATDPSRLTTHVDPVSESNDYAIWQACQLTHANTLLAYGVKAGDRGEAVQKLLKDNKKKLFVLKLTKDGHPYHPLYQPDTVRMSPLETAETENA